MTTNEKEYPTDPLALSRLEICKKCSFFTDIDLRCKICGCSIRRNINEENSSCPVGKW